MGSTAAELGLDLKLCAEKAVGRFLDESSAAIADEEGRAGKLEECLKGLEEERTKIEAFKRELPLSILLVTDVVEILKQKLEQWRSERDDGDCDVLEEPIPVRSKFEEDERVKLEKDYREKMNWMSSAQLWIDNYRETTNNNSNDSKEKEKAMDEETENSPLESRSRGGRGAFVPFSLSGLAAASSKKEERAAVSLPDLSLSSAGMKASRTAPAMAEELHCGGSTSKEAGRALSYSPAGGHLSLLQAQQQPTKKTRRCWSPELHRRFLLALQQLGGDQVATPKQIRELMKVEGLTNDEVKSHLQKYRLHTRRAPTSSSQNRSVVVVGGLWVPHDRYTASKQSAAQSGSPQGPLQLVGSARAVSVTAGDSFEDDGKSESYSWK